MDKTQLQTLLDQYNQGLTDSRQNALLEQWLLQTGKNAAEPDKPIDYDSTGEKIWAQLSDQIKSDEQRKIRTHWFRISAAAAAVLILLSVSFYFFRDNSGVRQPGSESPAAKSILPGHYGATITLSNNTIINLDSTKKGVVVGQNLLYDDGTRISGEAARVEKNIYQTLIANTSRGQTYSLTLSDGSKVWLNADSKLEFPANFKPDGDRTVKLTGEGYFEIAKDAKRPFIVETLPVGERLGQFVEVLGTHFNINSYGNEPAVKTTLLEGLVAISRSGEMGKARILKPGEQSSVGSENTQVTKVDVESAVSWKDNKFIFEYTELPAVMRMIERWYDIKVIYEGKAPEEKIWGTVTRYQDLSVLLKFLESTGKMNFRVEGRTVYVSR